MAFKGTRRRSAYGIAAEIEAVGGHLNAYTSREQTAYYAKVLKEDVGLAVDLIGDILQHSTMKAEELDRERAVIIQEIHQARDTPDDIVFDHFQETAYPDQAMGRPVLGSADLVRRIERAVLLDFMAANYSAPRMVVAAAGKIDHDVLVRMVEDSFTELPEHKEAAREDADYRGGYHVTERELEQVHLILGTEGISYLDDGFYAASVFSTLFGGGMSSRLFQEIREMRGLVYAIYSFLSCYTDGGLIGIYAGTGRSEAGDLVPLILDEINKAQDGIDGEEIDRARSQLKASILMSLESASSRCEQLARQISLFGRPIPADETVGKIDAVDGDAIRTIAERLFAGPTTQVAVGPASGVERVEAI